MSYGRQCSRCHEQARSLVATARRAPPHGMIWRLFFGNRFRICARNCGDRGLAIICVGVAAVSFDLA
jgi:hypothetical protein